MTSKEVKHEDKIWLRGWWIQYHYDAHRADTETYLKQEYIDRIKYHSTIFPCEHCIKHYQKYLDDNPIDDADSLFVYMWNFHNAVNVRLGKKTISLEECKDIYIKNGYKCDSCSAEGDEVTPSNVIHTTPKVSSTFLFSE